MIENQIGRNLKHSRTKKMDLSFMERISLISVGTKEM